MALLKPSGADAVQAVAALAACNPFVTERAAWMARALGPAYVPFGPVWHADGDAFLADPNTPLLRQRVEQLAAEVRQRLVAGIRGDEREYDAYRGLVSYLLWLRYEDDWYYLMPHVSAAGGVPKVAEVYGRFADDALEFLKPLPGPAPDPPHLFALGYQLRRAFDHIFRRIYGGSRPAAELRARVWESLFTFSAQRYRSTLYRRMRDIPTLITGESGTGKELVARAIGLSQFIPFDADRKTFVADPGTSYFPVNLSACPRDLVESEMFGHRRGAFTDAVADRVGCFERCGNYGTVFLDEVGDLDPSVQLKLLRILQDRQFHAVGDNDPRHFAGKIVAATNRDLEEAIRAHQFRADLYFRICADTIHTPSLREQLADTPGDLRNLVTVIALRVVGAEDAPTLVDEVEQCVERDLGRDYGWPGNMRELEQCVRGVVVHRHYRPHGSRAVGDELMQEIRSVGLTAEQLLQRYVAIAYAKYGSYRKVSDRLDLRRARVQALAEAPVDAGDATNSSGHPCDEDLD